jgi:hypothetical protein
MRKTRLSREGQELRRVGKMAELVNMSISIDRDVMEVAETFAHATDRSRRNAIKLLREFRAIMKRVRSVKPGIVDDVVCRGCTNAKETDFDFYAEYN